MLKKMTIANLNGRETLKKNDLMQVGGSICDMPMPDNSCLIFCNSRCGIKAGTDEAQQSGQDVYQT